MNLFKTTLRLARKTTVSPDAIARHLGVTTRWYSKVLTGEIKEPSVVKIQKLHDYLESKA